LAFSARANSLSYVAAAFCDVKREWIVGRVQATEWQRIGNQIEAATVFARANFVSVL
jgi:hypothetical protein